MDGYIWLLVALSGLALLVVRVWETIWLRPLHIQKYFEAQGIRGPSYKVFYGNSKEMLKLLEQAKSKPMELSHHILPRVIPFDNLCIQNYGRCFLSWFGRKPRVNIPDPDLIREILSNKFGHYQKPPTNYFAKQVVGYGLVTLEGEKWVKHRRIINPAFHMDQLKGMIPAVATSVANMLEQWSMAVGSGHAKEIEVSKEFRCLTADVISRTAFGSSYSQGKHIFDSQVKQTILFVEADRKLYIPGYRFLPTKNNIHRWKLDRDVKRSLRKLIERREQAWMSGSERYGDDLLGLMMTANKKEQWGSHRNLCMKIEDVIDECKVFFLAGHETTSSLLTWTVVLLGMHQDWQERARREVLQVCGKNVPNSETINRLKIVTMVLNETLRLYPPVPLLQRQTYKEMKLGSLVVPENTGLLLPVLQVHHDPELWGEDVHKFKPERFAEGVAKAARNPSAFIPFGLGPRICVGQNFAMLEAKLALAMILQRFSFSLSPSYVHAPTTVVALQPQHGAQVLVDELQKRE